MVMRQSCSCCRELLQVGHTDAQMPPEQQSLGPGKVQQQLMSISTHLFASQMPEWHNLLQSEVARSLLLAGMPAAMPMLTFTTGKAQQLSQSAAAQQGTVSMSTEGLTALGSRTTSSNNTHLLLECAISTQAAEAASTQSHPLLLHQALALALSADWGPADFGACEPDSSGSDSSGCESRCSESAEDGASQQAMAATGYERVLVVAVVAAFSCLHRPTNTEGSSGIPGDHSKASEAAAAAEVSNCISCIARLCLISAAPVFQAGLTTS